VQGEKLNISLESGRQMREALNAAIPMNLRLIEPTMEDAFLKISERRV